MTMDVIVCPEQYARAVAMAHKPGRYRCDWKHEVEGPARPTPATMPYRVRWWEPESHGNKTIAYATEHAARMATADLTIRRGLAETLLVVDADGVERELR